MENSELDRLSDPSTLSRFRLRPRYTPPVRSGLLNYHCSFRLNSSPFVSFRLI